MQIVVFHDCFDRGLWVQDNDTKKYNSRRTHSVMHVHDSVHTQLRVYIAAFLV